MTNDIWKNENSIKHRGGFPLKPPLECVSIYERIVRGHIDEYPSNYKLLLLGVTPELANIPWPQNVFLHALDKSQEMIDLVWEENKFIQSDVQLGNWESMPFASNSINCILGDGCTTQLKDQFLYKNFFNELARVINTEGLLILRCFIRPYKKESLSTIIDEAQSGQVTFFGSLKWRIAMYLTNKTDNMTIRVSEIHKTFNEIFTDRAKLSQETKWPLEIINTIDVYKNSTAEYSFPNLKELENLMGSKFKVSGIDFGNYELSNQCPILTLKSL